MDGNWMDGWMGGWMDGKAGLRIAYNNQKKTFKNKKVNDNQGMHERLKVINKEIRNLIKSEKSSHVQRGIIPGNSKSLWNAVKKLNTKTFH